MARELDPRQNLEYYTREALRDADIWTDRMIRQEYSRLRDIAEKRLKRLAAEEPGSYAYRKNVGEYLPARGQETAALRAKLPQLAKFIAAKTGTVRGIRSQRSRAITTLHEHGYTGINAGNIKAFGEFMDEWRARKLDRTIGSPPVYEFFMFTKQNSIPWEVIKEHFADWLAHREELYTFVAEHKKNGETITSDMILSEFDRIQKADDRKKQSKRKGGGGRGRSKAR